MHVPARRVHETVGRALGHEDRRLRPHLDLLIAHPRAPAPRVDEEDLLGLGMDMDGAPAAGIPALQPHRQVGGAGRGRLHHHVDAARVPVLRLAALRILLGEDAAHAGLLAGWPRPGMVPQHPRRLTGARARPINGVVSDRYDLAIIGGGIVALATACALGARAPRARLVILEKEPALAAHQTGHNSGVIHSGIYYRPGSSKAKLCVEGARLMVEFCAAHGIHAERIGKVIVATEPAELPRLDTLYQRGTANGVPGLRMLDPDALREIEPNARAL